MTRRAWMLLLTTACLAAGGCGSQAGDASAGENGAAPPAAGAPVVTRAGYDAADDLVEYVRGGAEHLSDLLDLVVAADRKQQMLLAFERSIARWDTRYAEALNEVFGDGTRRTDGGLARLREAIGDTPAVAAGRTRMHIDYRDDKGDNQLTLVQHRGRWQLHPTSFSRGERITDHWYFEEQFILMSRLDALRTVTAQVLEGIHETVDAADAAVADRVVNHVPGFGQVAPDDEDMPEEFLEG